MTQQNPEYGAIHGMMHEWDDGDLAASTAQQASMDAQKRFAGRPSVDTYYDDLPSTWTELTRDQRAIIEAVDAGLMTQTDAESALDELEKYRSK